jgi:hypothetical protein
MSDTEARAWWADVQHVREAIERRRGTTDRAGGNATAVCEDTVPRDHARVLDDAVAGSSCRCEVVDLRWEGADQRPQRVNETRSERAAESVGEPLAERRSVDGARGDRSRPPARHAAPGAATVRRTVRITGRPDDRYCSCRPMEINRRRPRRRPADRVGHRPDRIALWAALLGFFLILVAATSSHAAPSSAHRVTPAKPTAAVAPAAVPSTADTRVRRQAAAARGAR